MYKFIRYILDEFSLGAVPLGISRTNPPAVRCISSLRYEDAASIRAREIVFIKDFSLYNKEAIQKNNPDLG